jgi:DNA-binding CsgD family transcriptional regulator
MSAVVPTPNVSLQELGNSMQLTNIDRKIINLIVQGYRDAEIALCLKKSEAEIQAHLSSVYSKLQISGRLELIIHAYYIGLVNQAVN